MAFTGPAPQTENVSGKSESIQASWTTTTSTASGRTTNAIAAVRKITASLSAFWETAAFLTDSSKTEGSL